MEKSIYWKHCQMSIILITHAIMLLNFLLATHYCKIIAEKILVNEIFNYICLINNYFHRYNKNINMILESCKIISSSWETDNIIFN